MIPSVGIIIPARNIPREIADVLHKVSESCRKRDFDLRIAIVVDSLSDSTIWGISEELRAKLKILVIESDQDGPGGAIRTGLLKLDCDFYIVVMGDNCDEVAIIPELVRHLIHGADMVVPSRFAPGGRHYGGPRVKGWVTRLASLYSKYLLRSSSDPTNAFKAYSKELIRMANLSKSRGFVQGIELLACARRHGLLVIETPTVWQGGEPNGGTFRFVKWAPEYLRAFGRLTFVSLPLVGVLETGKSSGFNRNPVNRDGRKG